MVADTRHLDPRHLIGTLRRGATAWLALLLLGLASAAQSATLLAEYHFEEAAWSGTAGELKDSAGYSSGPFNGKAQGSPLPSPASASPALNTDPGTCNYASLPGPSSGGGNFTVAGLPVSTTNGAQTSVSFWIYWDGSDARIAIGWNGYDIGFLSGYVGFNTNNTDIYGASSSGLANGWHHIAAVFTNGSVTSNSLYIDGTLQSMAQRVGSPILSAATVTSTMNIGGYSAATTYRLAGRIDEVRVYSGAVNASEVASDYNRTRACGTLVAEYRFEEASWNGTAGELTDTAGYTGGPYNGKAQGSPLPTPATTAAARANNPGTCGYAALPGPANNGGAFAVTGLPVSTTAGAQTTLAFWMYWNGADNVIPISWNTYDLWLYNGSFGFNTTNSDIYGIASTGLSGGWHHVVAVFTNGGVTNNKIYIDGTLQTLTQRAGSPTLSQAVASSTLQIGGYGVSGSGFRFTGSLDEVKVYNSAVGAATVSALYAQTHACAATLLAEYKFEQASWNGSSGEVLDTSGSGYNGTAASLSTTKPSTFSTSPAAPGSPGTCRYAAFTRTNKDYVALPSTFPNLGSVSSFTVTAWVRTTDRSQSGQRIFIDDENGYGSASVGYLLSLGDRGAGILNFVTRAANTTELVTPAVITDNTWYFVAFGIDYGAKKKFISVYGASGTLVSAVTNTYTAANIGSDSGIATIGGESNTAAGSENTSAYGFSGNIDEVRVYTGALTSTELAAVYALRSTCANLIDHLEIQHGSGSGLTCTPSTLTVRACTDSACSALYTGGVSGTLTVTGSGITVNWPSGSGFAIASGSSSTTEDMQVTTAGSVVLGITGASPAPSNATTCNFGSPSCTFTAADSGFIFNVPDHRAEVSNTVSVTSVKKSDSSASCVPAFASVSKSVTFKCSYTNPTSGTLPVRVGGSALNSANSATSACDAGGRAVSLAFDSTGNASTTVQYADVGKLTLTASYTGSGSDAGLSMTGTDTFIAAPYDFAVSSVTSGAIAAGTAFAATVTARNYAGNATPNYGKEASPEGVTLGFVRAQPSGSGASNGSFSGTTGAWSGGVASSSNLVWSEVGRGDVSAVMASSNYLASGARAAGSSAGTPAYCAAQLATCTLPAGAIATVYYGALGKVNAIDGVSGSIGCNNTVFGDPYYGYGNKVCSYVVTSGAAPGTSGTAGDFRPHHFDVAVTPACGTQTYAGQPFSVRITAKNGLATPGTTLNYDGSSATTPNFAQAVTLSDAPALGVGSFGSTGAVVAALFSAGIATTATPAYTFTNKLTAAQSLGVRATDANAVTSSGYAEGTTGLRSGRLRLSNAFGSEKTALALTVQAQYWSGNAWVANAADSCTALPATAVVRSAYLDNRGAATTAWSTTASAVTISAGSGTLTLTAPSPTATGSVDLSLNLGATTTDQSCLAAHPASTGAALAWLRSQQGSCAATWDRDPAARASFGIYTPETRKTLHVREIF